MILYLKENNEKEVKYIDTILSQNYETKQIRKIYIKEHKLPLLKENDAFKDFKIKCHKIFSKLENNINQYLQNIGKITVSLNDNYDNSNRMDDNWVACYEDGSVFMDEISIVLNYQKLFDSCKQEEIQDWNNEITVTIWHEVGHGIVQYINDILRNSDDFDELYDNDEKRWDWVLDNEEESVEQFGEYMADYSSYSELNDIVQQINNLYNSINEAKTCNLIKENASSVIYHFTDFETFKKIAESDDFKLSKTNAYSSSNSEIDSNTVNDEINGNYKYYISFTRSPNINNGFSQWYAPNSNMSNFGEDTIDYKGIVRIEFDGNKLNEHFKTKPVDFFSHKFQTMTKKEREEHELKDSIRFPKNTSNVSSKEIQLTTPNKRRKKNSTFVNPNPFFVQNEDRLFSNQEYIDNVSRYITRVDIKIYDKYKRECYQDVFNLVHKTILGQQGKIHQYNNFNDLNVIKKNQNMQINGDIKGKSTAFNF